jgi:AcrR family transcriptional regulator
VTIDAIVARSGIAKSTIYRHWESRDEVLIDVMQACAPAIETPPAELGFERGLRALGREFVRILNDPEWTRIIPALFMLKAHADDVALLERDLGNRQESAIEQVLQRGVDEGRLRADYDLEEACASIVGPLLFAHLTGKPPIDDAFADRIIDIFLDAYAR